MEHRTISLAEQVFDRLENEILSGKFPRGTVLTEMNLVSELGVSRTPIREAIHRLEQEHIIETTTKGIQILGVTKKDLRDIFEIRLRIEGLASAEAAKRITPEELAELREAVELQEFYVPKNDPEHVRGMDSRFHLLIYRFSGNTALCDALLPLHKKVMKYRLASVSNHSRASSSAQEHRLIYEAIARHDAEAADARTVEHIKNAMEHILKETNE